MTLSLAYKNPRYPSDGLARSSKQKSTPLVAFKSHQIAWGTSVLVGQTHGTVVGYNIAGFGRWIGSVYPILVKLQDGSLIACKPSELRQPESLNN